MMRWPALLLFAAATANATTLTFPEALARATRVRNAASVYDQSAGLLEALPFRTLPSVRAETSINRAENLNLLTNNIARFDAFTALVSVDYPLLDGGSEKRRRLETAADAQLLRRRAVDESDEVFRATLDAFAQLYTVERRMDLLREGSKRATELRDRARTMLEAGQISNITAAQWNDQALATESQLLDLELQRLAAETRLKQLIGDTTGEPLQVEANIEVEHPAIQQIQFDRLIDADSAVANAALNEQRTRLSLEDAVAARKPQVLLSAFGGVAAVPSSYRDENGDDGTFGIYGLRVTFSLPMFDAATARRVAEARIQADEAARVRALTAQATRNRLDLLWLAVAAAEKRISLLEQAVAVARNREASVTRLVTAGVRSDAELVEAANEVARRESDLLAVRVDRWKLEQQVRRLAAQPEAPRATVGAAGLAPPVAPVSGGASSAAPTASPDAQ